MPRFAAILNGVVVGVLNGEHPPTIDVPKGVTYENVTDLAHVQGGESFVPALGFMPAPALSARLDKIEADVADLKKPKP